MIPPQRHLFTVPDDVAYLNCAYMAPLPRPVLDAARQGAERKSRPWELGPDDFFSATEAARTAFASIIGASGDDIAVIPAASYGLAVAARNLPLAEGDSVVVVAEQFPSNVYAWREAAAEADALVVTVPRPDDGDLTSALLDAIDTRTAVVAVPHCHWADGALIDIERVADRCRSAAAALVLDVTQSVGALPLDVRVVQPDFVVAAAYKWLLGPYSVGLLYVAPHRHEGRPIEFNWMNRAGSDDFAGLVNYRDGYRSGARRFDVGESANFATMPALVAALELVLEWGVEEIAATASAINSRIADRAAEIGLSCLDANQRAGHILGLALPADASPDILDRLRERNVHVSVRGRSLRVSPHVYNTDSDVDRLIDALAAALG